MSYFFLNYFFFFYFYMCVFGITFIFFPSELSYHFNLAIVSIPKGNKAIF